MVEPSQLAAIIDPLSRRAPDGSRVEAFGRAALGHALLATTPESLHEPMPFSDLNSGCTITADVRLDNRAELGELLDLGDSLKTMGDGELILRTYLRLGTQSLDRLRGDFAFAIWDPRDETVFCGRDQVGMRQLIYTHQPGKLFAFATEPRALLAHPSITGEVNEGRVGDYLEDLEACDLTSTFFVGIHRLPPAHGLVFDKQGVRTWRYWRLQTQPRLELPDDKAYAAAFLDVFTAAVRVRLRSPGPVGSMLSGGMDSGSVSAVAAHLLKQAGAAQLKTYSAIRRDQDCVESEAIRNAATMDHVQPTMIVFEDFDTCRDDLMRLTRAIDEPFDGHMTLLRAVYMTGHREGVKVMLDGVGGDTTLASENMVQWYLDRREFKQAWREAKGERRFWGDDADSWVEYVRAILRSFTPKSLRDARQSKWREKQRTAAEKASPIDPRFAERIRMRARRIGNAHTIDPPADNNERKANRALHPYVVVARERYDRTASALGIEPRDPFLDLSVLEFCLSLPEEQLQKHGWPKMILRRATEGLLPDSVRWRSGKEHLGPQFTSALWQQKTKTLAAMASEQLRDVVKPSHLGHALERPTDSAFADLMTFVHLILWCNHFGCSLERDTSNPDSRPKPEITP